MELQECLRPRLADEAIASSFSDTKERGRADAQWKAECMGRLWAIREEDRDQSLEPQGVGNLPQKILKAAENLRPAGASVSWCQRASTRVQRERRASVDVCNRMGAARLLCPAGF